MRSEKPWNVAKAIRRNGDNTGGPPNVNLTRPAVECAIAGFSSVEKPTRLIIRARRVLDLRRITTIVVVIPLLRIGLRGVEAPVAAARRRIARRVLAAAVGRIDVTIVGPLLRILRLAEPRLLRRQHGGLAGRVILLRVWVGRVAARDGGIAPGPRIARQCDLR